MEGRSSFHTIERVPMSNLSGWSSGFVDFAERLGKSQTVQHRKYTLLCPPGVAVSGDPKKPSQRTDPNRPVDGLTRLKELHAFLKPIHFELRYVDESKMSPELLRPIASDEYMIVIDNEFAVVGKTPPTFQGTRLIVRARELTQTEPLRTLVDALSSARRIDEKALTKWTKAAWVTG